MPRMWPHAAVLLRQACRGPGLWLIVLLGIGAGWMGMALSVLTLGDAGQQAPEIVSSTGLGVTALATLWLMAMAAERDRSSRFRAVLDACAPGRPGRLLGRWLGSALGGALAGALAVTALAAIHGGAYLLLYLTIVIQGGVVGAWGLLLGRWGSGGTILAGGLSLWLLGHLPFGSRALWPGPLGEAVAAWLPGPRADLRALAASALAAAGVLVLALWNSGRSESAS
jgi:hypothetical protein